MLMMLAMLGALAADAPAAEVSGTPGAPSWAASLHTGVGRVDGAWTALVRPRLALEGRGVALRLSAPMTAHLDADRQWAPRWSHPQTYLDWVERLRLGGDAAPAALVVGSLRGARLGVGTFVD